MLDYLSYNNKNNVIPISQSQSLIRCKGVVRTYYQALITPKELAVITI